MIYGWLKHKFSRLFRRMRRQNEQSGQVSAAYGVEDKDDIEVVVRLTEPAASDAPLDNQAEDKLDRSGVAKRLADAVMTLDASRGFVLSLQGPWGTGKTTLMNFIKEELDKRPKQDRPVTMIFNPWWFNSSQDIILHFFHELAATINRADASKGLRKIASLVGVLGKVATPLALVPMVGQYTTIVGKASQDIETAVKGMAEQYERDLNSVRRELQKALSEQSERIVVFIDDLDRLDAAELKQMFAIIKSIANLPNIIYVLALDRDRAATILATAEDPDGSAYLEKIIQTSIEIPVPTPFQMQDLLDQRLLDLVGEDTNDEELERLGKLYMETIQPIIQTPRDVNRYLNGLALIYPGLRDDVNTVDFLALECIRMFAPFVYTDVRSNLRMYAGMTQDNELGKLAKSESRKESYEGTIEKAPERIRPAIRSALCLLFPKVSAAFDRVNYGHDFLSTWAADKRACSPETLPVYFSLVPPSTYFSEADYQKLISVTDDAHTFAEALKELSKQPHMLGRGKTRVSAALEVLRHHNDSGFKPMDPYQALLGLAEAVDEILVVGDAEVMGLVTNDWRVWYLARDVLRSQDKDGSLLVSVIQNSSSPTGPIDWLNSCALIAEGVAEGTSPKSDLVLTRDAVQYAVPFAVDKLHQASKDGALQKSARLRDLLEIWYRWDSSDVRDYVKHLVEDDEGLILFLSTRLQRRKRVRPHMESIIQRETSQIIQSFNRFIDPERLQERARMVLRSGEELTEDQIDILSIVADFLKKET